MTHEDRVTLHLVTEVTKIINSQREKYGDTYAKEIQAQFVGRYVATLVLESLVKFSGTRSKSKQEYDLVSSNFAEMKRTVQEAIASAFSVAMSDFTGKQVEYYCFLQPIAETSSKVQH